MNAQQPSSESVILLADDREDDVLLTRHAFDRARVVNPVFVTHDGEETVAYLQGKGKFFNRDEYPLPDLLLLDLHMPKLDGFEVLNWVRNHPTLHSLRIVVLTTSDQAIDIDRAYELGANSFVVKVLDFKKYCAIMERMMAFWLQASSAPSVWRSDRAWAGE